MRSRILNSDEYISFRSTIPRMKYVVDDDEKRVWTIYDAGPKSVRCPVICLPPCSGTADVFFKQILSLSALGYRVISVNYPVVWSIKEWCTSFSHLLDHLHVDQVHLFGASVGGFLAQKFAEFTSVQTPRVRSVVLCNSFIDTTVFRQTMSSKAFWVLPASVLKTTVLHSFARLPEDPDIAEAVKFMEDKLDSMTQRELASRLTLNCLDDYVEPQKLETLDLTIMDVFDDNALTWKVREETYKCYPTARRAHLKTGGNFPYLSRPDEVNIFLQIHLKPFIGGRHSPMDPSMDPVRKALTNEVGNEYVEPKLAENEAVAQL